LICLINLFEYIIKTTLTQLMIKFYNLKVD
jgi:hypothetical protein